jgi:hypothetical protein
MAASLNGTRCPDSRSILTYSQSANPESPYFADQTRLFSRKRWVDMRFCAEEILRDRRLAVLELGCVRDSGLRSARVRRSSRGRVRLAFRRRLRMPVKVEVFRASAGRLRRVSAARRSKSFTLRRRLRAGVYVARFTAPGVTAKDDRRDVVFRMRGGRARVARRSMSRRERCGVVRSAALRSPLFRGSVRGSYKLSRRARVSVALLRGKRVVRRLRTRRRAAGTRRFTVAAPSRGDYIVRIVARAGKSRSVVRLAARGL